MAYITEVTYTQSGNANRAFTITFPFIDPDHIKVQLDGLSKTAGTDFTISGRIITFVSGVLTSGTNVVRIYRDTDIDDPLIIFQTGASVRAQDLNDLSHQLLYAIQEFNTLTVGSGAGIVLTIGDKNHITVNSASDWTINNNVISNAMMLDNSIGSSELINECVITSKIKPDNVTYDKIQDVTADHRLLGRDDSQVSASGTVSEIQVSTDLIIEDAVTYTKIQDVTTDHRVLGRDDSQVSASGTVTEILISKEMLAQTAIDWLQPIGTVIWYAGSTAPSGYLKCNGDAIANGNGTTQGVTHNFAALYAVVGANLPDLRGEFIRGFDDGKGIDSGRGIRTTQTAAQAEHRHRLMINEHDVTDGGGVTTKIGSSKPIMLDFGNGNPGNDNHEYSIAGASDITDHEPGIGWSGKSGSGSDNRPRNVALLACIKY